MVEGTSVKHCHGKKKGKTIKKFSTREEALAMHRAIQASKATAKRVTSVRGK